MPSQSQSLCLSTKSEQCSTSIILSPITKSESNHGFTGDRNWGWWKMLKIYNTKMLFQCEQNEWIVQFHGDVAVHSGVDARETPHVRREDERQISLVLVYSASALRRFILRCYMNSLVVERIILLDTRTRSTNSTLVVKKRFIIITLFNHNFKT